MPPTTRAPRPAGRVTLAVKYPVGDYGRHAGRYRRRCAVSTTSCRERNITSSLRRPERFTKACCIEKCAKKCTVFNTAASATQCLHEVPQLHGRKFPEPVLDLALGPLQEDPARGAVPLAAREVQPPPHRPGPNLRIGLHLHEDVPPLVAALQLTHVLGAVMAWEGSAHSSVG